MLNGYLAYLETKFTTATIFLCTLAEMALDFKELQKKIPTVLKKFYYKGQTSKKFNNAFSFHATVCKLHINCKKTPDDSELVNIYRIVFLDQQNCWSGK